MPFSAKTIRRLRRLLIGLACCATLIAVAWQIENIRGERAWNNYVREQERLGTPISALPSRNVMPPSDNFFETPLVQNLVFEKPLAPEIKTLRELSFLNVETQPTEPLEEVAKKIRQTASLPSAPISPETSSAQQILQYFTPWEPELALLHLAARDHKSATLSFPELHQTLSFYEEVQKADLDVAFGFTRVLALHARASLTAGREEDSFNDIVTLLKFSEGFSRSPRTLLEFLVGMAVADNALKIFKDGVSEQSWTASQLQIVQDKLTDLDAPSASGSSPLATCLLVERNAALTLVRDLNDENVKNQGKPWWLPMGENAWLKNTLIYYATTLDERRKLLQNELIPGVRAQLVQLRAQERKSARALSPFRALARTWGPNMTSIFGGSIRSAFTRRLALTACALERHYLAHGAYPESLTPLVPAFLPAVPLDADGDWAW